MISRFALVETGSHGIRITAVNARAARDGVAVGASLADARAALPALVSRPAEPARDRASLGKLARWAGRYGPARNIDGADGLWIDITGVAHLFGGERELLADLAGRLARFGVTSRLAVADTPGAAHALARFAAMSGEPWVLACAGATRAALAPLPIEALRLDPAAVLLLKRLGLRRIGQLYDLPRASLERRFRSEAASKAKAADSAKATHAVLARLDLALGISDEPRRALGEPPVLAARRLFAEPLISSEALEAEVALLAGELCRDLAHQALGCRRIRLALYRADGTLAEVTAGLSVPSREARHLLSLLREKLGRIDAGFGIDCLALEALAVARLEARQAALSSDVAAAAADDAVAALVDRLAGRLGAAQVVRLAPNASHIPERAERRLCALAFLDYEPPWPYAKGPRRPPFLLSAPEPITVMAEVPEGPPLSFTWRRVTHRVARAEGPERIAPEWWRHLRAPDVAPARALAHAQEGALGELVAKPPAGRPRDYYAIEDETGGAYWVFREGLYQRAGEDGPPRWFMHGLFG